MAAVIGTETVPMLPRYLKVEKSRSSGMPMAFRTALRWGAPTWWQITRSGPSGQPSSATKARNVSVPRTTPCWSVPTASVSMTTGPPVEILVSGPQWLNPWCCGAARLTPPTRRCAPGVRAASVSTMPIAPDPPVIVAIDFLNISMLGSRTMRSMVRSTIGRADSHETTMPARIWPSSMALATSKRAFITPRHALHVSYTTAWPPMPRASAVAQAVAGSRLSRQTPP